MFAVVHPVRREFNQAIGFATNAQPHASRNQPTAFQKRSFMQRVLASERRKSIRQYRRLTMKPLVMNGEPQP